VLLLFEVREIFPLVYITKTQIEIATETLKHRNVVSVFSVLMFQDCRVDTETQKYCCLYSVFQCLSGKISLVICIQNL